MKNRALSGARITAVLGALAVGLLLTTSAAGQTSLRSAPSGSGVASAKTLLAADPAQINFTLEGCRNDGSITLPIAGKFVCPDTAYTTGNLGKGWNELDLVPHRVTLGDNDGNQTYSFIVAGDYKNGSGTGTGWDVISDLTLNTAKSSASCGAATMGPQTITPSGGGVGGADQTIYRLVTVTQVAGSTCVYDYYQRLALGAHNFSGSSLQSNLWNQNLSSNGIGQKRLSLPVKEVLPQSISKDMSASQGSAHTWGILKSAPATLGFGNTCDPANRSKPVAITVTWTKSATAPNGDITITTHITATNPASRVVTVDVSDVIYDGATQTTQSTPTSGTNPASSGPVDIPANTTQLVYTHTITVASGSSFNDVATATYTDKVTGLPVPGNTQATASATVDSSGTPTNDTALIEDVESITGANLSYSVDSATGAGATGGSFNGYVLGTHPAGTVTWDSATQTDGSSVTFNKTVYVAQASNTNGTLSDTATVNGSDGFTTSSSASVSLQPSAQVSLEIDKTIPNVLQGAETQTFTFHVFDSSNTEVATPTITFGAGETSKSTTVSSLAPGTYTVKEDTASGWAPESDQQTSIDLPSCSGSVSFANTLNPANAAAVKVTQPAGFEQGWDVTLNGPGAGVNGETQTTDASGNASFATQLQEGSYTITETQKAGWEQAPGSPSGECSFTVSYPANAGHLYTCTFTNRKLAKIVVKKVTDPDPDPTDTSFGFTAGGGLSPSSFSLKNGDSTTYSGLSPTNSYSVAENTPAGWDLTSSTCDDGSPASNIDLSPGETVTCTFTNTLKRGTIIVKKVTNPNPDPTSTSFSFTAGGGLSPTSFSLANQGQKTYSNLLPGNAYNVAETVPAGWDLTSATCDDGSQASAIDVSAGETVTCTFTNRAKGKIIVKKVTNPDPDPTNTSFSFTAGGGLSPSSFSLANGGSQTYSNVTPGNGYSAAETVPAGWDLTSKTCDDGSPVTNIDVGPGETVTCTFTNTARGKAKVIKTFSGAAPSGTQNVTFQLRSGASALAAGTILESLTANAGNGGVLNFTTSLTPGSTYQVCEVLGPLGPGWTTTLGPPLYSVYNPSGDNSTVCTDFTVAAGATKTFAIDNKPPPGGLAFTIGYWKNWSSCTGGGQKPVLDQTLAKAVTLGKTITLGKLALNPSVLGASTACKDAVAILGKSTLSGKKMSSDPLFNMAAQLLAADLNVIAGSGQCIAAVSAINQAHALLTKYNFDGNTYSPKLTTADANLANSLATSLDKYNNNKLC